MTDRKPDAIAEFLWKDYAGEQFEHLRSYAVCGAEALARDNVPMAVNYFECCRMVGKELAAAFSHLQEAKAE